MVSKIDSNLAKFDENLKKIIKQKEEELKFNYVSQETCKESTNQLELTNKASISKNITA